MGDSKLLWIQQWNVRYLSLQNFSIHVIKYPIRLVSLRVSKYIHWCFFCIRSTENAFDFIIKIYSFDVLLLFFFEFVILLSKWVERFEEEIANFPIQVIKLCLSFLVLSIHSLQNLNVFLVNL